MKRRSPFVRIILIGLIGIIQQKIELSFTEPWTFQTRWRTDLVGFFDLEQQPGFDLRQYGSTLTIGHLIGRRSNMSLSYRYEDSQLSNVKTPEAVSHDYDPKVRSLTATYRIDDRDNPFNTVSGTYTELNSELAGAFLKGTNTFVRITGRIKYFSSFDAETALGTAFEVGWLKAFGNSSDVPLSERFRAGGPNALRSSDYQRIGPPDAGGNPLGGTVRLVWNLAEIRQARYKFIGAVGYIDIGQVWGSPADIRLKDICISKGSGLRRNTPLGMARLDYGFNVLPQPGEASRKLYFAMGQAF